MWFNWELVGSYRSYREAGAQVAELLALAPAPLHDLVRYLEIEP